MSLTKEQVLHLAKLSRLQLTEQEQETFPGQLSSILEYVGQLQAVNTSSVVARNMREKQGDVVREDVAVIRARAETVKLVKASSAHKGDLLTTKAVFSAEGG